MRSFYKPTVKKTISLEKSAVRVNARVLGGSKKTEGDRE